MKAIAEYFRDLAADDRYFGAEPPQPDAAMLHRIAEREIQRRVEAKVEENGIILRAEETAAPMARITPPPAAMPSVEVPRRPAETAPAEPVLHDAPDGGTSVAERLARLRAGTAAATALPVAAPPTLSEYIEDQHAEIVADLAPAPAAPLPQAAPAGEPAPAAEPVAAEPVVAEPVAEPVTEPVAAAPLAAEPPQAAPPLADPATEFGSLDEFDGFDDEPLLADLAALDAAAPPSPGPAVDEADHTTELLDSLLGKLAGGTDDIVTTEVMPETPAPAAAEPAPIPAAAEAATGTETPAEPGLATLGDLSPEPAAEPVTLAAGETDAAAQDDADWLNRLSQDSTPTADTAPRFEPEAEVEAEAEVAGATGADIGFETETPRADEPVAPALDPIEPVAEIAIPSPTDASGEEEDAFAANVAAQTAPAAKSNVHVIDLRRDSPAETAAAASQLSQQAEADLLAELAELEAEAMAERAKPVETAAPLAPTPFDDDPDLDRILAKADEEMGEAASRRRHDTIKHLKAAVIATKADRSSAPQRVQPERDAVYKSDLSRVTQPLEAAPPPGEAANRPPPLVLVSEQRVHRLSAGRGESINGPAGVTIRVQPIRPRRPGAGAAVGAAQQEARSEHMRPRPMPSAPVIPASVPAAQLQPDQVVLPRRIQIEEDMEEADIGSAEDMAGFAAFAEQLGARSLSEQIEAAAVYSATVLDRPIFARPGIARIVASLGGPEIDRSEYVARFQELEARGCFALVRRGRYAITDKSTYLQEISDSEG